MAGFGLPNFGQLTEAFKKAQEIQQNAQALQDELDGMEIEGKSSDGRASVWLSGNQQPLRVRLDPALLQEGPQASEAAALEALQAAYEQSTATMKGRMEELTGGLNLFMFKVVPLFQTLGLRFGNLGLPETSSVAIICASPWCITEDNGSCLMRHGMSISNCVRTRSPV